VEFADAYSPEKLVQLAIPLVGHSLLGENVAVLCCLARLVVKRAGDALLLGAVDAERLFFRPATC